MHPGLGGDGMPPSSLTLRHIAGARTERNQVRTMRPSPGASPASDKGRWQDLRCGRYAIVGKNRDSRAESSSRARLVDRTQGLAGSIESPVARARCRARSAEARNSEATRTSPGHDLLLALSNMLTRREASTYPGGSRFRKHSFSSQDRQPPSAPAKTLTGSPLQGPHRRSARTEDPPLRREHHR